MREYYIRAKDCGPKNSSVGRDEIGPHFFPTRISINSNSFALNAYAWTLPIMYLCSMCSMCIYVKN